MPCLLKRRRAASSTGCSSGTKLVVASASRGVSTLPLLNHQAEANGLEPPDALMGGVMAPCQFLLDSSRPPEHVHLHAAARPRAFGDICARCYASPLLTQ